MIRKFLQWLGWRKAERKPVSISVLGASGPSMMVEVFDVATGRTISRTPLVTTADGVTAFDVPKGCWFCIVHAQTTGPATVTIRAGLADDL